MSGGMRSK